MDISVHGNNVLVKETLTKKSNNIILDVNKAEDKDVYIAVGIVVSVGEEAKEIKTNQEVLFKDFASPSYVEHVEGKKGDQKIVRYAIYDKGMIAGTKKTSKTV